MAITKVTNSLVAVNAIQGTLIADNAITSVHIAQNQVTAVQIPDGSITSTQIAANSIDTAELVTGSIDTIHIGNDQVTTAKIADLNVTTGKIANNAITSAKIPDGSITATQLDSSTAPTFGNITTTGSLRGPASFTIDPAAVGDNTGTVVIAGSLQVDGTTTTVNSTTLSVADKNIVIASGAADAAAANEAGLTVTGASATLLYKSSGDKWEFNKDITTSGVLKVSSYETELASGHLRFKFNGGAYVDNNTTGQSLNFRVSNSSSLDTTAMTIKSDGSVGIGMTPTYRLDVTNNSTGIQGRLSSSSSNGTSFALQNSATNGRNYRIGSNFVAGAGEFSIYDDTASAERMRIDSSGNLFIGSERKRISTDGNGELGIGYNQTATNNIFTVYNGTTAALRVTAGGDVSVGSSHSGFSTWRVMNLRGLSTGSLYNFEASDGTRRAAIANDSTGLRFQTLLADDDFKFESSSGVIGVGTHDGKWSLGAGADTSPDSALHVKASSAGSVTAYPDTVFTSEKGGNEHFWSMLGPTTQNQAILFGDTDSNWRGQIRYDHDGDYMQLYAGQQDSPPALTILSGYEGRSLGIKNGSPRAHLHVGGHNVAINTTLDISRTAIFRTDGTGNYSSSGNKSAAHAATFMRSSNAATGDQVGHSYVFDDGNWSATAEIMAEVESATNAYSRLNFKTWNGSMLTRQIITSDGQVVKPYQSAFYARRNAGTNIGVNTAVVFNHTTMNTGADYNTSTGVYTAPYSGVYIFAYTVLIGANTPNDLDIDHYLVTSNDSYIGGMPGRHRYLTTGTTGWGDGYIASGHTQICYMDEGDTAYVQFSQLYYNSSNSGTVPIYGNSGNNWTKFYGYFLG